MKIVNEKDPNWKYFPNPDTESLSLRNRNLKSNSNFKYSTSDKDGNSRRKLNNDDNSSDSDDEKVLELNKKESKFKRSMRSCSHIFKVLWLTKGKRYGNYLMSLFVIVRILYTFNSIVQLFILNHFLGNDYLILGFEVIGKIWNGDDWTQLKRFPRVTMCDFRIREVGIVHRYTVRIQF